MKQKLLIIHPIIAPYRVDFFNALYNSFDCEVILWLRNLASQTFDYSEIERQFHFTPKYMTDRYGKLKLPKGILAEMRRFHPDIILCNECNPITIVAILYKKLFNRKCKVATIVDDSYDMATGGGRFSLKHVVAKRLVLPCMDQIICVEPQVTELYKQEYGAGVTMPIITEDSRMRQKLSDALPISEEYVRKYHLEGKKILLFVGRFVELKNMQRIIPLFLKLQHEDYVFVLVGEGPLEAELKSLAKGSGNIIFTGRLEGQSLLAWYNIAQLFVLASYKEAFGAVTNEALLAGCYALVSRKAGSQSLIVPGINGEVFDPYEETPILSILIEAFERASALSCPLSLRENKMPSNFQEYVRSVIQHLDQ